MDLGHRLGRQTGAIDDCLRSNRRAFDPADDQFDAGVRGTPTQDRRIECNHGAVILGIALQRQHQLMAVDNTRRR